MPREFTITLDDALARVLIAAADEHATPPEALIAECVAQQLETALRHRVLIERSDAIDKHIIALAEFIEEATAGAEGIDLSRICRYRAASAATD